MEVSCQWDPAGSIGKVPPEIACSLLPRLYCPRTPCGAKMIASADCFRAPSVTNIAWTPFWFCSPKLLAPYCLAYRPRNLCGAKMIALRRLFEGPLFLTSHGPLFDFDRPGSINDDGFQIASGGKVVQGPCDIPLKERVETILFPPYAASRP